MEYSTIIILPAILSLCFKTYLIVKCQYSKRSSHFTTLLYLCAIQSACEVITFISFITGNDVSLLFRFYYVSLIWWICYAFIYCVQVVKAHKALLPIPFFFAVVLSFLIIFTDVILSGYKPINYSITAIKENYYSVYQFYVFAVLLASITLLSFNVFCNKHSEIRVKSMCLLIGFVAPFLTIVMVSLLMIAEFKINMLMVLPISTAIFCWVFVRSEKSHQLTDLRRFMPYSDERKFSEHVTQLADQVTLGKINLKEADKRFQVLLIQYQIKQNNSNMIRTADALGVSKSTLYSKFKTLGISLDMNTK